MLEIKPCTEMPVLAAFCKQCGRAPSEAFYVYQAMDGDMQIGAALFEVLSDQVRVVYYEARDAQDPWLFDGILRAGLNYASQQGLQAGCIPEAFHNAHHAIFSRLNYPVSRTFDITNFFQKYKNCVRVGGGKQNL